MSSVDLDCNVVLLGANCVGKTCLVFRYIDGRFPDMVKSTIGPYIIEKKEQIDNTEVTLNIMDTSGDARIDLITKNCCLKVNAAIICYDVTRRESFDIARYWLQEVIKTKQNCKMYLCETKMDLAETKDICREVNITDTMALAEAYKVPSYKTSNKTGENIDVLFKRIAEDYVAAVRSMKPLDLDDSMRDKTQSRRHRCYLI